jgi:cobalt/nickel transport system permease protein
LIAFDQHAHLDSVVHRRDARSKVIAFFIPILLIASTPREQIWPYPFYFALLTLLVLLSRVPAAHILWRCAAASPFILMASAFLLATRPHDPVLPAVSVALKAYGCVALMTLLTATSRFNDLLRAMRSLGSPRALNLVASLMFRYMFLLQEEYQRMTRARESRTALPVRSARYAMYGRQFALLFIRSWERAERIHAAMLARGFKDTLKVDTGDKLRAADFLFPAASCAAFLIGRFSQAVLEG